MALAAALGTVTTVAYLAVMSSEGDTPAPWYLALLLAGVTCTMAGAVGRQRAGLIGGALLLVTGALGAASIGLPALVGGAVAVGATSLAPRTPTVRSRRPQASPRP